MDPRWLLRAGAALALRPGLWPVAVTTAWRLRRRNWWRIRPHLPLPSEAYLRFRMLTAYGDPDRAPEPADIVTYLHWCRAWPRVRT